MHNFTPSVTVCELVNYRVSLAGSGGGKPNALTWNTSSS